MDQHNNSIDNVDNGNRCRSPSIHRHDDPSLVIVDVEAAELLQQSSYPTHQQQQLIDEQALLKTVTVNRGAVQQTTSNCYTEYVRIPLTYVIGVPFCWLLLGVFQYFGCVAVLGDNLLDPWYFTCAWLVEIVCTLHAVVIFMIVKCTYVRVGILEYCEKITWIGFTFLLAQGLTIILFLLPISYIFKITIGNFSKPMNFFIFWTMIAFPHVMALCFASFGCCSKLYSTTLSNAYL